VRAAADLDDVVRVDTSELRHSRVPIRLSKTVAANILAKTHQRVYQRRKGLRRRTTCIRTSDLVPRSAAGMKPPLTKATVRVPPSQGEHLRPRKG